MATRSGLERVGTTTSERSRSWWRAGTASSASTIAPLPEELYSERGRRLAAAVDELHAARLVALLGGRRG